MNLAVIKTGGKQYLIKEGDVILVEKIAGQAGKRIVLDQVLLVADEKEVKVGVPLVSGAKIEAEILEQIKGPKVKVIKFKRKVRYHRKRGYRQPYTRIKITKISL